MLLLNLYCGPTRLFGLDEQSLTHNIPAMKFLLAACLLLALVNPAKAATDTLSFNDGDHISIIGNALADRLQHDGWLETLIQAHFADRHLTIRNLGFAVWRPRGSEQIQTGSGEVHP